MISLNTMVALAGAEIRQASVNSKTEWDRDMGDTSLYRWASLADLDATTGPPQRADPLPPRILIEFPQL
jgi:hypothetical protein